MGKQSYRDTIEFCTLTAWLVIISVVAANAKIRKHTRLRTLPCSGGQGVGGQEESGCERLTRVFCKFEGATFVHDDISILQMHHCGTFALQ